MTLHGSQKTVWLPDVAQLRGQRRTPRRAPASRITSHAPWISRGRLDLIDTGGSDAEYAGLVIVDEHELFFFEVLEDPARLGIVNAQMLGDRGCRDELTDAAVDELVEVVQELTPLLSTATHRFTHGVSF